MTKENTNEPTRPTKSTPYKYKWREWSVDTRLYTIESDRKLSKEELDEIGQSSHVEAEAMLEHVEGRWEDGIIKGTTITYNGVEYGDDAQSDSWEVK